MPEVFEFNFFETNKCYEKGRTDKVEYREGANYCPQKYLTYIGKFTHLSQGNPYEANFSVFGPMNLTAEGNKYFRECPCRTGGKRKRRTRRR